MAVTLRNSTALVTGGSGFVGSHLVEELIKNNVRVITTTHDEDKRSYFYTQNLDRHSTTIRADIRDFHRIFDIVTKYQITHIFHLAAQPLVEVAYDNPLETFTTNIIGTANVLESARLSRTVKGVIVASSDKAYGKLEKRKYKENDPLKGDHPYESSKSATDLLSYSYFKTYSLPVVVTRFGNIYGEGDLHFSRLIPETMEALIRGNTLHLRSNGKFVRDYLYVKDVVLGYIDLMRQIRQTSGNAYNFGSKETLSVLNVLSLINKTLNKKVDYKILNNSKNEIPYQSLQFTKISKAIGWRPQYTLQKTIPSIYHWYQGYFKGSEQTNEN